MGFIMGEKHGDYHLSMVGKCTENTSTTVENTWKCPTLQGVKMHGEYHPTYLLWENARRIQPQCVWKSMEITTPVWWENARRIRLQYKRKTHGEFHLCIVVKNEWRIPPPVGGTSSIWAAKIIGRFLHHSLCSIRNHWAVTWYVLYSSYIYIYSWLDGILFFLHG